MRQQRREEVTIFSSLYAFHKHAPPMSELSELSEQGCMRGTAAKAAKAVRRKVDFDAYA